MYNLVKLNILFIALLTFHGAYGQFSQNNHDKVLAQVIENVKSNYIFPEVAEKIAEVISKNKADGKYRNLTDKEFTKVLSTDLVAASNDKHFNVIHKPTFDKSTMDEKKARATSITDPNTNYGFDEVKCLKGNIGYIKCSVFSEAKASEKALEAAMNFVGNTNALIIDLRNHIGGHGDMVMLFCGYFFPKKTLVSEAYLRPDDVTFKSWTAENVSGKKYFNKPVYILIGKRTISASEAFAYNLQQYKLATLVGESTFGAANPVAAYKCGDFDLYVPVGNEMNTISKTNWEHVGVKPDVASEMPLYTAQVLVLEWLLNNSASTELQPVEIKERITELKATAQE